MNIEAAVKVVDMIRIYKQHGAHPNSDIISGLLDLFLIEPGFDPDLYKHVLEEESTVRDDVAPSYGGKPSDFPFDDNCKPICSMPMPIRSTIPAGVISSFSPKNTTPPKIKDERVSVKVEIPSSGSVLNASMAALLRDEWEAFNEDEENIEKDTVRSDKTSIECSVSIPLLQSDNSSLSLCKLEHYSDVAIAIENSFSKDISLKSDQKEVMQKRKTISDKNFSIKMTSSTYQPLQLKPRSISPSLSLPLPPKSSNKLPPTPSV